MLHSLTKEHFFKDGYVGDEAVTWKEKAVIKKKSGKTCIDALLILINPFPHDKILDQTKLKAFADDILNVTKLIISVFDRV